MTGGLGGLVVPVGIVVNILSVVGIVIVNKYITEVDKFDFMVFLSFLHFVFTGVGIWVILKLGFFQYKAAEQASVLPVALGSLLSVAFMNLNLSSNSVGFFQVRCWYFSRTRACAPAPAPAPALALTQLSALGSPSSLPTPPHHPQLSKLACIPFTLFAQRIMYKQTVTRMVQLTLVPILFGVGYATVYDLSLNFVGCVFAVCAIVATSMAQIFTNTYQKSLDCDAMQLLYHTSPLISIGMLLMSPFFDDWSKLWTYQFSQACVIRIATSCVFALGVNISNYLVLGKTSPLTYQVLGHLKTILILFWGFTVFKKTVDMRNVIGIAVALVGVIAYTEVRRRETTRSSSLPTHAPK